MKINNLIKKYSYLFDESDEKEKVEIARKLAGDLREIKKENEDLFRKQIFKICRCYYVKRKIMNYSPIQKIEEFLYMYCMRRFIFYFKKLFNISSDMPESFYLKPAYYWEYEHEVNWFGYWGDDIIDNFDLYCELIDDLNDSKSRLILINIMMARLTNNWKYYSICCDNRRKEYFDDEIINLATKEQIVIGGGGFTGDTYQNYYRILGKEEGECIKKWYLYEPDRLNMDKARENLRGKKNVVFRQVGLGESNGMSFFDASGSVGSSCREEGNESIEVVTLDSDVKEKITFLKLDIEGKELEALKGAYRHLIEDKPQLAICLYHKRKDILEIINYIRSVNSDYNFFIRHYSEAHWDTVLYAV